jgi:ankyrin repeat protein
VLPTRASTFVQAGESCLILATRLGRTRIVELCIEYGADVNDVDNVSCSCAEGARCVQELWSPLLIAAHTGNHHIFRLLLDAADPEQTDAVRTLYYQTVHACLYTIDGLDGTVLGCLQEPRKYSAVVD